MTRPAFSPNWRQGSEGAAVEAWAARAHHSHLPQVALTARMALEAVLIAALLLANLAARERR